MGLFSLLKKHDDRGFDKKGNHKNGTRFDDDGYDQLGYKANGYNKEGYDINGYNKKGYNKEGYDKYGYSKYGYDKEGYDKSGYNRQGYDRKGNKKKSVAKNKKNINQPRYGKNVNKNLNKQHYDKPIRVPNKKRYEDKKQQSYEEYSESMLDRHLMLMGLSEEKKLITKLNMLSETNAENFVLNYLSEKKEYEFSKILKNYDLYNRCAVYNSKTLIVFAGILYEISENNYLGNAILSFNNRYCTWGEFVNFMHLFVEELNIKDEFFNVALDYIEICLKKY